VAEEEMKLGVLPLFNEVSWANFAIDQAMMLCNKLLIVEGSQFVSFPDIPERSDDGTLDIISDKQKQYSGKIEVIGTIRKHMNYRKNQCENYNIALNYCEIGDYFISLTGDHYFLDDFIPKANRLMKDGRMDYLSVELLRFIFGFKWTIGTQPSKLIFKKVPTLRFYPTSKPTGFGPAKVQLDGISCHHYTWVKPRARMRMRMRTSGFYKGMLEWFDKNWDKIELAEGRAFNFVHKSFILRSYDGKHSTILDNHPWRHVEDIRRIGI